MGQFMIESLGRIDQLIAVPLTNRNYKDRFCREVVMNGWLLDRQPFRDIRIAKR
jgi:hypothetical protein